MTANGLGADVDSVLKAEKDLAAQNPVFSLVDPATKPNAHANAQAMRMKQLQQTSQVLQLQLSVVHQMQEQLGHSMQQSIKQETTSQDRMRMVRHELDAAEALAHGLQRPMSPIHENSEPLALDRYNSTTYYRAVGTMAPEGPSEASVEHNFGHGYAAQPFHGYYQHPQQPPQQRSDLAAYYSINNILQNATSRRQ